mmetsp:Transcript_2158/g.5789  ORF Transcript_2158/g.5789 Transcript_2158/m.5789 type:complete len:419 (-) Transcript_2158:261-1517(-)
MARRLSLSESSSIRSPWLGLPPPPPLSPSVSPFCSATIRSTLQSYSFVRSASTSRSNFSSRASSSLSFPSMFSTLRRRSAASVAADVHFSSADESSFRNRLISFASAFFSAWLCSREAAASARAACTRASADDASDRAASACASDSAARVSAAALSCSAAVARPSAARADARVFSISHCSAVLFSRSAATALSCVRAAAFFAVVAAASRSSTLDASSSFAAVSERRHMKASLMSSRAMATRFCMLAASWRTCWCFCSRSIRRSPTLFARDGVGVGVGAAAAAAAAVCVPPDSSEASMLAVNIASLFSPSASFLAAASVSRNRATGVRLHMSGPICTSATSHASSCFLLFSMSAVFAVRLSKSALGGGSGSFLLSVGLFANVSFKIAYNRRKSENRRSTERRSVRTPENSPELMGPIGE